MPTVPKSAGLATQATWKMYIRASSRPALAAQSWKWGAFPDRALFQICLAESNWDSQVLSLITSRFYFPEPETLNSTQPLLRKMLKDTLQGEHWAECGLTVFQVKLSVKGFENLCKKKSNTIPRQMIYMENKDQIFDLWHPIRGQENHGLWKPQLAYTELKTVLLDRKSVFCGSLDAGTRRAYCFLPYFYTFLRTVYPFALTTILKTS